MSSSVNAKAPILIFNRTLNIEKLNTIFRYGHCKASFQGQTSTDKKFKRPPTNDSIQNSGQEKQFC